MKVALTTIYAIWLREAISFWRERGRIIGMVGQPMLYLLILGNGITSGMRLNSAGSVGYIQFLYPGVIAMSVLFTSMFSSISIIWDREFGFLKEVLVAPVPRWGVAIGKALGGATTALVQTCIMVLMAPLAGISLSVGLVVQLLFFAFLMAFAITSMGVAIASRMKSMQSFQMIMNFLVMPVYFLSGAMFPMSSAPPWLKGLMALDPLTYSVDGLRHVIFANTALMVDGVPRSLLDVATTTGLIRYPLAYDVALTVVLAVVCAMLGSWSFSRTEAG